MTDEARQESEQNTLENRLLAELERKAESGDGEFTSELLEEHSDQAAKIAEYRRCFAIVDGISSPLRTALCELPELPNLPDYGDLEEIGRGGMGVVYRGRHVKTQRIDAIKIVRPDCLVSLPPERMQLMLYRFQQESRLAAGVAHEHIVPVYYVGELDGCPWFSMQFVDGANLHELSRDDRLSAERAARYVECIARAIDAVHRRGILHGDIKPHNILIDRETDRPLITDFGLAEFDSCDADDASFGIAGTPAYMAPELARAALQNESFEKVSAVRSIPADIYSLGATLWAVLTGESPHVEGSTPREQLANVADPGTKFSCPPGLSIPSPLHRICGKCLESDPANRYASASQLADELAEWLERPRWHRHFPRLGNLLWSCVAPGVLLCCVAIYLLLQANLPARWIATCMFLGYAPLFAAFLISQRHAPPSHPAQRELWSIWIGHFCASLAGLASCCILFQPDFQRAVTVFFPCWAALSSLAFFAKSGNFWIGYRWIGASWAGAAVLMAAIPTFSPIVFGVCGALTCVTIAFLDRAFADP